jgi:hypothetical protein
MGSQGFNALHTAAYWSNRTAIQMIKEHVDEHYPDKEVPYNVTTDDGITALDCSARAVSKNMVYEEDNRDLDVRVLAVHQEHAIKCYRLLRESGALHSFELKGFLIKYVTARTSQA